MKDIRWRQRYSNYSNIIKLLKSNFQNKAPHHFNELEQIGLAKSFELCFELLWKLLKDYLEYEDVEIGIVSPKNILKAAAAKGLLEAMGVNGDILMQAHKSRNSLVHVYDQKNFNRILTQVQQAFLPEMIKIDMYFKAMDEDEK
jgi:nucleotidyltransferase substrate binding protein (TIGR01987 family)